MEELNNDVAIFWAARKGGYSMDRRTQQWKHVLPVILRPTTTVYFFIPTEFSKLTINDIVENMKRWDFTHRL